MDIGGSAGGAKYIIQGILYKFSTKSELYRSERAAQKVAGHDLKVCHNLLPSRARPFPFGPCRKPHLAAQAGFNFFVCRD